MFRVRPESGEPVYRQLIRQTTHAVATGVLRPGDQLPTVRDLAATLGINPNTVARAYRELEQAGTIETAAGRGSFISHFQPKLLPRERKRRLEPFITQLLTEGQALGYDLEEIVELLRASARAWARPPKG